MDDLQKMTSELAAECIAVQKEIGDERLFHSGRICVGRLLTNS